MNVIFCRRVNKADQILHLIWNSKRWTFFGDSYHESDLGRLVVKTARNWFEPVAVLEGRMEMREAFQQRQGMPLIQGAMLEIFGQMRNLIAEDDTIAMRLPVPVRDNDILDESKNFIGEPPALLILRADGSREDSIVEHDRHVSLVEAYLTFSDRYGAFNPYREELPKLEGNIKGPEGRLPRA